MSDDSAHPDPQLQTIFATSEADLIPVIKSVLRGAGIEYVTDGESMMNLFPSDLLGPALHRPRGEMRFMVAAKDVAAARAMLEEHPGVPTEVAAADAAVEGDDAG